MNDAELAAARSRYQQWSASGGKATWWEPDAAAAAAAAGIQMHDWSRVVRTETTPWGEGINYDAAGNQVSATNPEWTKFVNSYKPAAPAGPMEQQGPASTTTRSVMGAEQAADNPWDPETVRRNQYDVGY